MCKLYTLLRLDPGRNYLGNKVLLNCAEKLIILSSEINDKYLFCSQWKSSTYLILFFFTYEIEKTRYLTKVASLAVYEDGLDIVLPYHPNIPKAIGTIPCTHHPLHHTVICNYPFIIISLSKSTILI